MLRSRIALIVFVLAVAIGGCLTASQSPQVASPTDEQLVLAAMDQLGAWTTGHFGQKDLSPDAQVDPDSFDVGNPGPGAFRRVVDRSLDMRQVSLFDPDAEGRPTRAVVRTIVRLDGRFLQTVQGPGGGTIRAEKPLREEATFLATLERATGTDEWTAVRLSHPRTASPTSSAELQSVRVQGAGIDWTMTDADAATAPAWTFWPASGPITVTISTGDPDQAVTLFDHEQRFPLTNNGMGTYSRTFTPEELQQIHRFALYVVSRPSLADPTAPYDAAGWMLFRLDPTGAPTL